jgi:hypothetical protein
VYVRVLCVGIYGWGVNVHGYPVFVYVMGAWGLMICVLFSGLYAFCVNARLALVVVYLRLCLMSSLSFSTHTTYIDTHTHTHTHTTKRTDT